MIEPPSKRLENQTFPRTSQEKRGTVMLVAITPIFTSQTSSWILPSKIIKMLFGKKLKVPKSD